MANIWEKVISILAGNLNLGHGYLITTVTIARLVAGRQYFLLLSFGCMMSFEKVITDELCQKPSQVCWQ